MSIVNFLRPQIPMPGRPGVFRSPLPAYSEREFYVRALISPLPLEIQRDLLTRYLARPRRLRPPVLPDFTLTSYSPMEAVRFGPVRLPGEVLDELDEIERVLSLPYGEISGMSRYHLLAVHTQRLRQLWWAFQQRRWPGGALAAFRALLA